MAIVDQITPSRILNICIKTSPVRYVLQKVKRRWRRHKHPHIRSLSPHLARDIGLDHADLARHQHQWPSETHIHPRL